MSEPCTQCIIKESQQEHLRESKIMNISVKVKIVEDSAILPKYMTPGASGCDLFSAEDLEIGPGNTYLVSTGLQMSIPEGYELQIRPRSGLALKNQIMVLNSPGTVDSDFRGTIKVILFNGSKVPFKVQKGDRIAQGVFTVYVKATFPIVEELDSTERNSAGFGTTGV